MKSRPTVTSEMRLHWSVVCYSLERRWSFHFLWDLACRSFWTSQISGWKSRKPVLKCHYWPGINYGFSCIFATCSTSLRYCSAHPTEKMQPHDIPDLPFQKIARDIMTFRCDYLVIADYYSKYSEMLGLALVRLLNMWYLIWKVFVHSTASLQR